MYNFRRRKKQFSPQKFIMERGGSTCWIFLWGDWRALFACCDKTSSYSDLSLYHVDRDLIMAELLLYDSLHSDENYLYATEQTIGGVREMRSLDGLASFDQNKMPWLLFRLHNSFIHKSICSTLSWYVANQVASIHRHGQRLLFWNNQPELANIVKLERYLRAWRVIIQCNS